MSSSLEPLKNLISAPPSSERLIKNGAVRLLNVNEVVSSRLRLEEPELQPGCDQWPGFGARIRASDQGARTEYSQTGALSSGLFVGIDYRS